MKLRPVRTVGTSDPVLNKLQENLVAGIGQVISQEIVDGNLLQGVTLTAGSRNLIAHGLGRAYRGWLVVKKRPTSASPSVPIYVWDINFTGAEAPLADTFLNMWTDQNCTVSLWVF